MEIKGITFGGKKPVLCVPVVERTAEEILAAIRKMTENKVDMIEWRMDWFEHVTDEACVKELLEAISASVEHTVFLCTFRSRKQGGEREITGEQYLSLNLLAARTGVPDLIDLEYYETDHPKQAIDRLRQTGVKVICSHHNFRNTPETGEMEEKLTEMLRAGADFAKLAVMPEHKSDVLRLMEAVLRVKEEMPDSHLIAMSMGKEGVISRLLGGWYHSEVTFAAFGKASAPGQIPYTKAEEILDAIKDYL